MGHSATWEFFFFFDSCSLYCGAELILSFSDVESHYGKGCSVILKQFVRVCVCARVQAKRGADCHSVWSCSASPGLSPFTRSHPQRHQEWLHTTYFRWKGMRCSFFLCFSSFVLGLPQLHNLSLIPRRSSFQTLASVLRSARTSLRGSL